MAQAGRPPKKIEPELVEGEEAANDEVVLKDVKKTGGQKKYRIIIDEQDNTDKNQSVFATDGSGKPYLIPRGIEVVVPVGVVNVIKESVYTITSTDENGNKAERYVKRHAMRDLGEV